MKSIEEIHELNLRLLKVFDKACGEDIHYILGYGSALGAVRHHGFIPWDTDVDVVVPINELQLLRSRLCDTIPNDMRLYQWDKDENYHPAFDRLAYKDIPHEEVHIDIYPLCGAPDDEKECNQYNKSVYSIYNILHCKYKNTQFSKKSNKVKISLIKLLLLPISNAFIRKTYTRILYRYEYDKALNVRVLVSPYAGRDILNKEMIMDRIRIPICDTFLPVPKRYDEYLSALYGDYMTPKKY